MISDSISDDIPPQMKIFNMIIPILMHFCSLVSNWSIDHSCKILHFITEIYILKDFRKALICVTCLFHMADLRVFPLSFFILLHTGP